MLSQELMVAHAWFHEVQQGRAEFTAEGAVAFDKLLAKATRLARALEEALPPVDARAVTARIKSLEAAENAPPPAGNVVAFRRPRELQRIPIGNDGGAA